MNRDMLFMLNIVFTILTQYCISPPAQAAVSSYRQTESKVTIASVSKGMHTFHYFVKQHTMIHSGRP